MEESPRSRMTLRQAIARQWQIPLFIVSLGGFAFVLFQMRPEKEVITFQQEYERLESLAEVNRYSEFYAQAELLRQNAKNDQQLGMLHGLVAKARVKQLKQRGEFGVEPSLRRSAKENYQAIINDYNEAMARKTSEPTANEVAEVFHHEAMAYWCLNDAERAIMCMDRTIELQTEFDPAVRRELVQMFLAARPEKYLERSLEQLEELLARPESEQDDRAWAFVRKAEVLIAQGHDGFALDMLNNEGDEFLASQYREELEFLRGRALCHAGRTDQADLVLRKLIAETKDRGDIYAQTALELGKINYEQCRDYDAKQFYELVVGSQIGKDWYTAGKLGLAESQALRRQYAKAAELYQETIDLLRQNPNNRAVTLEQVQESLAYLAYSLSLEREYRLALTFLELEQQIAPSHDLSAAQRFAQMHSYMANQLLKQLNDAKDALVDKERRPDENEWLAQQQGLITMHYEQAAKQFAKVAELAMGDDDLYGRSLWNAAATYDKAGNIGKSIETWRRFILERQGLPEWPRALFLLAQSHQAILQFDEAITYYILLRDKHPKTLAAFDAVVPLARCFLAKDPPDQQRAEKLLQSVLIDHGLMPDAPRFRDALFELGKLYYDTEKYPESINTLTEAIDRYPDDDELGKPIFLVADSYRRSGLELDKTLEEFSDDPTTAVNKEKTSDLRRRHLENAWDYFNRAIKFYEQIPESRRGELDSLYLRHCYLYRADCLFDLGRYREASQLYEEVVLRYQLTATALASFVQIINCQLRLGNPAEARSTGERAMWQLRRMSDEAVATGPKWLSREQWQDWFTWVGKAGLWQTN